MCPTYLWTFCNHNCKSINPAVINSDIFSKNPIISENAGKKYQSGKSVSIIHWIIQRWHCRYILCIGVCCSSEINGRDHIKPSVWLLVNDPLWKWSDVLYMGFEVLNRGGHMTKGMFYAWIIIGYGTMIHCYGQEPLRSLYVAEEKWKSPAREPTGFIL